MQLSLNWLKDYVKIHKKTTAEEIGQALSLHTVEVEKIINEADKFDKVVVGKILEVKKHPNADKLQLAKVDVGDKVLDIVCGAPNIASGQLVPVALVGAILPNGLEIKEAEVRGEKSAGMLCAADEIGLGNDHSGILILDKKAKIGQSLVKHLGLDDIVLEVDNKSLSNRPDLWGHYGIAREIAAIFNVALKPMDEIVKSRSAELDKVISGDVWLDLKARVDNQEACPRYMAMAMSGIKIGESPEWIKKRLSAAGLRPINNIVDITNFVMLELGQPMHAFDASLVENKKKEHKIIVRSAIKGETMETLDGNKRELSPEMLLIANGDKALAIAGVMGGANSGVIDGTNVIIIESANFNPVSIRKTSGKLALRTESSMRYEKALDPHLCETALLRAVDLIKEICPEARQASMIVDMKNFVTDTGPLEIDANWLNKKIGHKIPSREVVKILNNLGFKTEHLGHKFIVNIPTWRATKDVSIPEDVVEEIVRIFGFDKIDSIMPEIKIGEPERNEEKALERKIKNILVGAPALTEVYNYSFVGEEQLKKLNIDFGSYVRLVNPIISQQTMLRQSLVPNLISNVRSNQAKNDAFGIFEIGSIFMSAPGDINKNPDKDEMLPYQEKHLGLALAGNRANEVFGQTKGALEHLFDFFKLPIYFKEMETKPAWSDQKVGAAIMSAGVQLGTVMKLDSQSGKRQGLKKEVVLAEISLRALLNLIKTTKIKEYSPLEKYPAVERDLAFVVDVKILYNDIKDEIAAFNRLIRSVELFDVYEGEKLGSGKKSLAFHIIYQTDRTMTNEEVDRLQQELFKKMEEKFEAKVRDF